MSGVGILPAMSPVAVGKRLKCATCETEVIVVKGTDGDDSINIDGNGSGADVTGLATAVSVEHADRGDVLSVNTLAGNDNVSANGVFGALEVLVDGDRKSVV